jgi:4-amino-4-deoxy-L-arabinose transferase-like glycosyltransferase
LSIERHSNFPLFAVLIAAAALRVWGIGYGLPNTLAHPDEGAVFSVALRFFGRNLNPAFFDWPSLFMYAVAAAFVVYFNIGRMVGWFGREVSFIAAASTHPAPLFLIARALSAAAGIATVAVTYRIGVHLFDRATALVAALFLAVAALHVRESHFGLTDVSATCLLMASFLYIVRYWQSGLRRDALLAALLGGLAASTKYNAGIVTLPLFWAIASRERSDGRADRVRLMVICAFLAACAFAAGTPYALLDASHFAAALREVGGHLRRGHMALAGYAWQTHLTSSLRYGLGLPMLVAGLGGMGLLVFRRSRDVTLFLLCPLVYFALIGAGQTAFARYILPTIPFLCLSGAFLVTELARTISRWSRRPAAASALAAIIAALIAAPSLWSAIQTDRLLARVDNRVLAAAWLRENFQDGASLFQTGSSYGHLQMQKEGLVADPRYSEVPIDATPAPDIIVVLRCPLGYCDVPEGLNRALTAYVPLTAFAAARLDEPELVYDRDDAFFVPLSGFRAVTRPGPNVEIYGRRTIVR